jgi:hypothetical protein
MVSGVSSIWLNLRETAKFGIYFVLACMYTIQVLNYIWFGAFIRVLHDKFFLKKGYVVQFEGEGGKKKQENLKAQ